MRSGVCILGGGLSALAAAARLRQDRVSYVVLDKRSAQKIPGWWKELDRPIAPDDRNTLSLLSRLGLGSRLRWQKFRSAIFFEKTLWEGNPWKFLIAGPLQARERWALLSDLQKIARVRDAASVDNQSAASFLDKFCSGRLARQLLPSLLQAKYGTAADHLSAGLLVDLVRRRISGRSLRPKRGVRAWLSRPEGPSPLADASWESVARVTCVERIGQAFRIRWERNGQLHEAWADTVINTLPAPLFLRIAKNPPPRYALDLQAVRYQGRIAVDLRLAEDIGPYDALHIAREGFPFSLLRKHAAFLSLQRPAGRNDAYWSLPDREILRRFLEGLADLFPAARKATVQGWTVSRKEFFQPVFEPGCLRNLPPQKAPWEGLFHAGPLYAYPDASGADHLIGSGFSAARLAMDALRQQEESPAHFLHRESLRGAARS